ncbi:MAG: ABC transporter substrate-binding protein, partial [Anaerolineae bacterium]|nr:ABC transporter substrate-binding protein [Anaerolineae bacterium]
NNIITPADLTGKTIAVSDGAARTRLLIFLAQQGIGEENVTVVPRVTFGIEPLMNGEVDVLAGWIINEAVMVEEAGSEANVMLLSDYGLDHYEFIIFTSQETLDNRPEMVERFLRAFLAGTQDILSDTNKTTDAILKYNDQLDRQGQLTRLEAMLPLINPPGQQLGVMSLTVWEQSQQVLIDQGILSEPIDLSAVFTNSILDKIYGSN